MNTTLYFPFKEHVTPENRAYIEGLIEDSYLRLADLEKDVISMKAFIAKTERMLDEPR